jgi:hypothetical protein
MGTVVQRCFTEGDAVVLVGHAVGRVRAITGLRMTVGTALGDVDVDLDQAEGLVRHAQTRRAARALLLRWCTGRRVVPTALARAEVALVLGVAERLVAEAVRHRDPRRAARGTRRRVLPLPPAIEGAVTMRSFWVDGAARVGALRVHVKPGAWHAYAFVRGTVDDELVGLHLRHADLGVDAPLSMAALPRALRGAAGAAVRVDHARRATAVFVPDGVG